MDILPVSPLRNRSGALVALVDALGGDAQAQPIPLEDPEAVFTNFSIVADSLSVSTAATLGLGTIFKGQIAANEQAFFFDAMSYTDRFAETTGSDQPGQILGTRWGVGLRITLRVEQIQASTALNFGLVGAAVELGYAKARYEIQGLGIGGAFSAILGDLPGVGNFDYRTYLEISGPVRQKVSKYIVGHKRELKPQPMGVALARSLDPLTSARGVYFAMSGLAMRMSLNDVLQRIPIGTDHAVVEMAYAQYAGAIQPGEHPSDAAQHSARDWLNR